MSGPVTVTVPGAGSGRPSVNTLFAETARESCAETTRATVAPGDPEVDAARRRTVAVWFASTVTFRRGVPSRGPLAAPRERVQPTAATSFGFVTSTCTVSRAFPSFLTWSV